MILKYKQKLSNIKTLFSPINSVINILTAIKRTIAMFFTKKKVHSCTKTFVKTKKMRTDSE